MNRPAVVLELLEVCDLMTVDAQTLVDALTSRTVNAMKEAVKTDLSATEVSLATARLAGTEFETTLNHYHVLRNHPYNHAKPTLTSCRLDV